MEPPLLCVTRLRVTSGTSYFACLMAVGPVTEMKNIETDENACNLGGAQE